jgi:hydrogenase-4 component F
MAPALLLIAFVLWLVGFGAKAGLVPLHTWLPDAHSQAPAPICALLSGVETSGALYMLLRIAPALLANDGVVHPERWYLAAGLASVAVSAVLLLQVRDFKRLFAYSTIEHMGIVLAACGLGGGAHQLGTTYQFFAHAFTKSFCFYTAGLATIILGSQRITAGTGLIGRAPMTGWALLLGGIAIAGAPPFAIFVGEFEILRAGFLSHQYLASGLLTALVVLAFIAIMYQVTQVVFGEPTTPARQRPAPVTCIVATAAAFVPVLVFGVYVPAPLQALIHQAAQIMGGT